MVLLNSMSSMTFYDWGTPSVRLGTETRTIWTGPELHEQLKEFNKSVQFPRPWHGSDKHSLISVSQCVSV